MLSDSIHDAKVSWNGPRLTALFELKYEVEEPFCFDAAHKIARSFYKLNC